MNAQDVQIPDPTTVEAVRMLEQASSQLVRALRSSASTQRTQDAGASEYDSWAGALEYDSWLGNFQRR